jgi:sulfite exporter TauE/SafE
MSALLPCGSLWLATGLAASAGGALAGFATMLGFAGASAAALLATAWLGGRLGRRSLTTRRVLAAVAVLGAAVTALRPITATASTGGDLPPCHRLVAGARP